MPNFAIIETGGKQYKVSAGDKLKIEKLEAASGSDISFDRVLLNVNGDTVKVGQPYVASEKVAAKVLMQGRGEKKLIFKYHSKTRLRRRKGHRQPFTEVEITKLPS